MINSIQEFDVENSSCDELSHAYKVSVSRVSSYKPSSEEYKALKKFSVALLKQLKLTSKLPQSTQDIEEYEDVVIEGQTNE
jgi:hypothetical protein